jgi:hypothetical protein
MTNYATATGEHDTEPVHGLPEALPSGEQILWQGAPDWKALALRAMHVRTLGIYFGILVTWRVVTLLTEGEGVAHSLLTSLWLVAAGLCAIGILGLIAWFTARTAVYTITNKRVVMRVGVVLTVTFNIPFGTLKAAGLRAYGDGTGDIPLTLSDDVRISYLHLWPHARPWHVARPQPMLRAIPHVAGVAEILSRAAAASEGAAIRAVRKAPTNTSVPASEGQSLIAAQ